LSRVAFGSTVSGGKRCPDIDAITTQRHDGNVVAALIWLPSSTGSRVGRSAEGAEFGRPFMKPEPGHGLLDENPVRSYCGRLVS
jgi:hypothetical protein